MTEQRTRANNASVAAIVIVGLLLLALVTGGVLLALELLGDDTPDAEVARQEAEMAGITVIDPPQELQDFTLVANNGEPLSLSDLRGRLVLVYFGYTHCPDACPATLLDFRRIKRDLGDEADNVVFLLISVDGERDTPEFIDRYLQRYDPEFIGMSGTDDVLQAIQGDYSLVYERRETAGSEAGYLIDHTASKFLIDREGRLARVYSFIADPSRIAADIRDQL